MKVSRFLGFFFLSVSLLIQAYTLGLPNFSYPGWHILSEFINTILLGWIIRKEILSIDAVMKNQNLIIEKYFFFIKTYRKKIDLKQIIRIWVGKKIVIIKMENQNIELNVGRLNKQVYKRLLLFQKYQLT
ncbi:MAG TPA: hypothetical protein VMY77_17065 [Chitinophagaceae bacterium]|nr:hypothetical protein [Chitinophagaceae bacterium]